MNNRNIDRLSSTLDKEQAKLDALIKKQAETEAEIKAKRADVADLSAQLKTEKLNYIADLLGQNGVSVDDLLNATDAGDFLSMQDKFESNTNHSEY